MLTFEKLPKVFAIVLNWNGYYDSKNCLNSLLGVDYKNLEIVLVDNSSTDDSYQKLIEEFNGIHFTKTDFNGGYAYGMNWGIKFAKQKSSDYYLILNNDTIFDKKFLAEMISIAELDHNIGIVSPKVGYIQEPEKLYCGGGKLSFFLCGGISMYQGKPIEKFALEDRFLSMAEGCCMLIKKDVIENVGYFNEKYFLYFEEVDFSIKVRKTYKIAFASKANIYHRGGAGIGWANYSSTYYYYYTRNRFLLFKEHDFFYKIYVFIFSGVNVLLKLLTLYSGKVFAKDMQVKKELSEKINALIKGLADGLKLFSGKPKSVYGKTAK